MSALPASWMTSLIVMLLLAALPARGEGVSLRGSVVLADGVPAEGARVDIATAKPRQRRGTICPSCYADCRKVTFTDGEGRFQFDELDPSLTFRLLVTRPGSVALYTDSLDPLAGDASSPSADGTGAADRIPLFLAAAPTDTPPERLVRGRLVDRTGQPVPGGLVSAAMEWMPDGSGRSGGVKTTAVVSDDDGRFEMIVSEPVVSLSLDIEAEGYAGLRSEERTPGGKATTLVVPRGASVSVRVARDGIGLPGVELAVVQLDRDVSRHFVKDIVATTGADGIARFEHLPPDERYSLHSTTERPQQLVVSTTLFRAPAEGKDRDLGTIEAVRSHTLSGRVVTADGTPIPRDTRVFLIRPLGWSSAEASVGPDGAFEFRGLPSEAYRLSVDAKGLVIDGERLQWALVERSYAGIRIDESLAGVTIPLVAGVPPRLPLADRSYTNKFVDDMLVLVDHEGTPVPLRRNRIEGVVVDTTGRPVRGVDVSAWPLGHGTAIGPRHEPTGDDGRFSLDSMPDVPIELIASIPNDQTPSMKFWASAPVPDDGGDVRMVIDPRLFRKQPDLDPKPDPAVTRQRGPGWPRVFMLAGAAIWLWSVWSASRNGKVMKRPPRSGSSPFGSPSATEGTVTATDEGRHARS